MAEDLICPVSAPPEPRSKMTSERFFYLNRSNRDSRVMRSVKNG
jgi:hypothetical protein